MWRTPGLILWRLHTDQFFLSICTIITRVAHDMHSGRRFRPCVRCAAAASYHAVEAQAVACRFRGWDEPLWRCEVIRGARQRPRIFFLGRHSTGAEEEDTASRIVATDWAIERAWAKARTVLEDAGTRDLPPRSAHHKGAAMRSARRASSPLLREQGSRADVARR